MYMYGLVLQLMLDATVLFSLVWFFQREFAPDFKDIIYVALGLSVAIFVLVLSLGSVIGVLVVIPAAVIVGFALMYFCSLPISQASVATVGYLGYKTGLMFLLA